MHKYCSIALTVVSMTFGQAWLKQSPPPEPLSQEQTMDSSQIIADRVTASSIPVLIDFWAVWCRPCRMLGPTIEEIKEKYAGKILVMKVNVDVNRALAGYFRIQSIPAVFIIANKSVVDVIPGLQPREVYEAAIQKVLGSPQKPSAADSAQTAAPKPGSPKTAQSNQSKKL